ncbi:MAG: proton-conducting transporter membrane subunit [Desulfobacterales bacterium]
MIGPHIPLLIPITYLFLALLVPLLGWLRAGAAWAGAIAGAAFSFALSLAGLQRVLTDGVLHYHLGGWPPPIGIAFVMDPLSAFLEVVITGIGFLVLIYARRSVAVELPERAVPFASLAMLLLTGLSGMVITGDLFNLYVFLEISALAGYALIAVGGRRASFSAFRYLTMGTVGASFYLLGLAFLYITQGTLNMADLQRLLALQGGGVPVTVGILLILLGAGLKMALFPLHAWLPDAYTHASSAATSLIAPIGTKVAAYVMIRVLMITGFPPVVGGLAWLAAAGILAGSILAIAQTNLKRMLAYSSVANVGYIALGVCLAHPLAFTGAVLHILNHALMKAVLFQAAGGIAEKMGTLHLFRLRGLPARMPWTTAAFLVAVLSMVGIPPTGGFFSKIYLLFGAIETRTWAFVAVILVSTLLNFFYFFRVIEVSFFRPDQNADPKREQAVEGGRRDEMSLSMLLPMLVLAAAILAVGIGNGPIVDGVIARGVPGF